MLNNYSPLKVFATRLNLCHLKNYCHFFFLKANTKWVLEPYTVQHFSAVKRTWTKMLLDSFSPTKSTRINLLDDLCITLQVGYVCFIQDRDKEMFHIFHRSVLYMWSFFPYNVTCFKQFGRIYSSFADKHTLLPMGLLNSVNTSENYTLTHGCLCKLYW